MTLAKPVIDALDMILGVTYAGSYERSAINTICAELHRLADVESRLEVHVKMLADCFRMAGADPDGNEDWRIATDTLRAVTDLRRDYDEVTDWQVKYEAANALLRKVKESGDELDESLCRAIDNPLQGAGDEAL